MSYIFRRRQLGERDKSSASINDVSGQTYLHVVLDLALTVVAVVLSQKDCGELIIRQIMEEVINEALDEKLGDTQVLFVPLKKTFHKEYQCSISMQMAALSNILI